MFQTEDLIPIIKKKLKIEYGQSLTDKQLEEILAKYWLSVLYALNNVDAYSISLSFLGNFNSRYTVLKFEIRRLITKIRLLEEGDLKEFYRKRLRNMLKVKNKFSIRNLKSKLKNERRNKSIDECKEEL